MLLVVAGAVALALVASSLARVQTRHVVVVKGRGFSELAWDALGRDKKLCFLVKSGKPSSSVCGQRIPASGISFTSLQNSKRTFTLVGGVALKKVKKVLVTFADGKQLTVPTKAGNAYRGRKRGKVRFWAIKHAGPAPLRTVIPKTA